MRALSVFLIFVLTICGDGWAAAARRSARATSGVASNQAAQAKTTAARAATNARAAAPRAATQPVARATSARSAKNVATKAPVMSARAGATQKVIGTGTKVSTAVKNTVVSDECAAKYNGCMDAFCMLDNESGGRCICSNKLKTFDSILSQIEDLEKRSYEMATLGVAQVELGADADAVISAADATIAKIDARKKREAVDLSLWKTEEQEMFSAGLSELDGKEGDELYAAVAGICKARIPECANDIMMLQMLYGRQIESDCAAYDNSLKQKKLKAEQALDTAERTLREAAMESHQNANKYDLGQCTIKFKECMQTTAGCGEDFSGCATVVASDNTNISKSGQKNKKFVIEGAVSSIEISASTYDALVAKRPMCESVTKECVRVADQVFGAFLKEAAPQIRNAELIAEDKMRQNCVMDIADCFQNACKDNIDPSDPDGSYDMCLTRPETMLNLCKIPLNACGIDATQASTAQESSIWNFVLARLASMRVDSCTTSIKSCLADSGRCGKDYVGCVGLDINTVVEMCPLDKLVACDSSDYGLKKEEKLNYVYNVAQGLLLGIDNKFLEVCENAVASKMIEICGNTINCFAEKNEYIGTNSLRTRQVDGGDWLIDGLVMWGNIGFDHPNNYNSKSGGYSVYYNVDMADAGAEIYKRVNQTVIADIQSELNRKMSILISDPTINMCINGRDISQIKKGAGRTAARFPNLLVPYANVMFDSLMAMAKANYNLEYANQFSRANSLSEQYKNTLFCTAMVNKASGGETMLQDGAGVKEWTDYSVLIAGTAPQNQLDAIAKGVDVENVITVSETVGSVDPDAKKESKFDKVNVKTTHKNEIARERTTAVYEPGPQVCRITKTLYPCLGFNAAYNEESESYSVDTSVGVEVFGVGVNTSVGVSESESSKTYQGKTCAQYAEPLIIEQLINFKDENVIAGQITRSNLTSMTVDQSSTTTSTTEGWSLSLAGSYADDHSQNQTFNGDNMTVNNKNKVQNQNINAGDMTVNNK